MNKQKFAIKQLNTILLQNDENTKKYLSLTDKAYFLSLLLDNGYSLDIQTLKDINLSVDNAKSVLANVVEIKGANVRHKFLLGSFPIKNENQIGRSFISLLNFVKGKFGKNVEMTLQEDAETKKLIEKVYLQELTFSENVDNHIEKLFYSKIPLSLENEENLHSLFETNDKLLENIKIENVELKEILARFIAKELKDDTVLQLSAKNAIDVMRGIAIYSGCENAKLDAIFKIDKLSNPMRRKIIKTLDKVAVIEDLTTKKDLFKRLFKLIHVHETKYSEYENIRKLAKELQTKNNPKTKRTEIFKVLQGGETAGELVRGIELLKEQPSLFLRNLDTLLRKYSKNIVINELIDLFENSNNEINSKILLQCYEHFINRYDDKDFRLFTLKGKSKQKLLREEFKSLDEELLDDVCNILYKKLISIYSKRDDYNKNVFISPDLFNIVIPKNLSNQDNIKVLSQGSRIKFEKNAKVIRMFVHWADDYDLDLSAVFYNNNIEEIDKISFCELSSKYGEHSGDVRSAPMSGASEFVDIYLDKLDKNIKYVSMNISLYSGESFDDVPDLFAGYMMREDSLNGKVYEPKTVKDIFTISGGREFKVCLLFDVENREVISINSSQGEGSYAEVSSISFSELINSILNKTYITVGELLAMQYKSHKILRDDNIISEDDIVFDSNYGYNVNEIVTRL